MSTLPSITKPANAVGILSLFVPQNGVIQGSRLLYGGGANGRASPVPKTDSPPATSDTPARPKMLTVCKNGKAENRLGPALEEDEEAGSLPGTPDLGGPPPDYPDALDGETRQLVGDFFRGRTGLSEPRWSCSRSKTLSTMNRVVDDVIEKHRLAYNGMISKLALDDRGDDMSVITSVAKQMFNDGTTNWGRIVSLVAFGAVVCQHQKNSGRGHCVELVGQEISSYLLSDQRDWMVKNNAWEGFVEFFRIADPESSVRNTLMAFAGVAGIGATLALLIR